MNALCQMTGMSRAGFYRFRKPRQASSVEMESRDQMQKIALDSPAYGYRRITAALQQRGFDVNHKRVLRMMREDSLLCVRRRNFVVTTDSWNNLPVYPNLAGQLTPTAVNQLWIADITYRGSLHRLSGFEGGGSKSSVAAIKSVHTAIPVIFSLVSTLNGASSEFPLSHSSTFIRSNIVATVQPHFGH